MAALSKVKADMPQFILASAVNTASLLESRQQERRRVRAQREFGHPDCCCSPRLACLSLPMLGTRVYDAESGEVDGAAAPKGQSRYVPVQQQIVTDQQGRRRFHGAFTGGFSAGYFNSVGSKEGWTPQQFTSSRSNRAEPRAARPEDFMDEEDLDEHAGPALQARRDIIGGATRTGRAAVDTPSTVQAGVAAGLAGHAAAAVMTPEAASIGHTLLRLVGWQPGRGVGEDVAHADDTPVVIPAFKDDYHGVGYAPMTLHEQARAPSSDLLAFASGGDDDAVYDGDIAAAAELPALRGATSHGLEGRSDRGDGDQDGIDTLPGFKTLREIEQRQDHSTPVEIPDWFDENNAVPHEVRDRLRAAPVAGRPVSGDAPAQTAAERAHRLGERVPIPPPPISGRVIPPPPPPRARASVPPPAPYGVPPPPPPPPPPSAQRQDAPRVTREVAERALSYQFQPYSNNEDKQTRYTQFLRHCRNDAPIRVRDEAHRSELQEFVATADMFRPLSGSIGDRFQSAKTRELSNLAASSSVNVTPDSALEAARTPAEKAAIAGLFGALTHTQVLWQPIRLVCKRFGVPYRAAASADAAPQRHIPPAELVRLHQALQQEALRGSNSDCASLGAGQDRRVDDADVDDCDDGDDDIGVPVRDVAQEEQPRADIKVLRRIFGGDSSSSESDADAGGGDGGDDDDATTFASVFHAVAPTSGSASAGGAERGPRHAASDDDAVAVLLGDISAAAAAAGDAEDPDDTSEFRQRRRRRRKRR